MNGQDAHGSKQEMERESGIRRQRVDVAQVGSDGGIALPEEWTRDLGWHAGDELAFSVAGTRIVVTKVVCAGPSEQE